jgi:hypothetical protein
VPAPVPDDFPLPFYMAVGELIISWAFLEQKIDVCVRIVFDHLDCSSIQTTLPQGPKRKAQFLKRAFKEIPELAPFADSVPHFSLAKHLAHIRHTAINGTLAAYDSECQTVIFSIFDSDGLGQKIDEERIPIREMLTISGQCQDLTKQLQSIAERLSETFVA